MSLSLTNQEPDQMPASQENEFVEIISFEELPNCIVNFKVRPKSRLKDKCYKKAENNVCKEVSIAGFRKGKAPINLIKDRYGKAIQEEWKAELTQEVFSQAASLCKVYPYKQNSVNIKPSSLEISDPEWCVEFNFEKQVIIKLPNVEELSFEFMPAPEVSEKNIDNQLENLRFNNAIWINVERTTPQEGDYVKLMVVEGENILIEDLYVKIDEKINKNFKDVLLSMSVGEEKFMEDFIWEGKTVPATISLNSIDEPQLPEMNEEFFKKYEADSLDSLKEQIKKALKLKLDEQYAYYQYQVVKQSILQHIDCPIPLSVQKNLENYAKKNAKNAELPYLLKIYEDDVKWRSISALYFDKCKDYTEPTEEEVVREIMHELNLAKLGEESLFNDRILSGKDDDFSGIREEVYESIKEKKLFKYIINNSQHRFTEKTSGDDALTHQHSESCPDGCSHS